MPWPAADEYSEAVQNPKITFTDPELKDGFPACNSLGLPIVSTGAFASVYRFRTATKDFAVRCFLRNLEDRAERYRKISQFILQDSLPSTVDFSFIEKGIRVGSDWYPILKMEWVEGQLLNAYIAEHVYDAQKMTHLAESFREMVLSLQREGLAHGDLQHGNVLICDNDFRLVDYDGVYVPDLVGHESQELGHPNYQHPRRTKFHFGPYLDNFASWIIYITIRCLSEEPELWRRLNGGDEKLLLGRQDYAKPSKSAALVQLLTHKNPKVRGYGELVLELLDLAPHAIPSLEDGLDGLCQPTFSRLIKRMGMRAKVTWEKIKPGKGYSVRENAEVKATAMPEQDGFQKPDWVVTQQSQTSQQEKQGKWYEQWSEDTTNALPPLSGNSGLLKDKLSRAPLPPKLVPQIKQAPIQPTSIYNSPSIPSDAQWKRMSLAERQKAAVSQWSLNLVDKLKRIQSNDFDVAVQMSALKCLTDETDARIFTVMLADLIVNLRPPNLDKLPILQASFQSAFINCRSVCPPTEPMPEWAKRAYFQVLDALLSHASKKSFADLAGILETWFHVYAAEDELRIACDAVENRLFSLLRQHHRTGEYREEVLKTLLSLVNLYDENERITITASKTRIGSVKPNSKTKKNFPPLVARLLLFRIKNALEFMTNSKNETLHMKMIAGQYLTKCYLVNSELVRKRLR